jgi:hypothetical protein
MGLKHMSCRTEACYLYYILRFIRFHGNSLHSHPSGGVNHSEHRCNTHSSWRPRSLHRLEPYRAHVRVAFCYERSAYKSASSPPQPRVWRPSATEPPLPPRPLYALLSSCSGPGLFLWAPTLPLALIHPSAWNRNSANFALTAFSETRGRSTIRSTRAVRPAPVRAS